MDTKTIRLPILDLSEQDLANLFMLSAEDRFKLVDRIIVGEGLDPQTVPEAWSSEPLKKWCWLVLTVNEIPFDADRPQPLTNYGIDLGFSDTVTRRLIWVLA